MSKCHQSLHLTFFPECIYFIGLRQKKVKSLKNVDEADYDPAAKKDQICLISQEWMNVESKPGLAKTQLLIFLQAMLCGFLHFMNFFLVIKAYFAVKFKYIARRKMVALIIKLNKNFIHI